MQCGYDNSEGRRGCEGCGHIPMPRAVVLRSEETGREKEIGLTTSFGRPLLQSFAGPEAVYASEKQFDLVMDETARAWTVRHHAAAKNPTHVQGRPIDAVTLEDGATISIGPSRMKLHVRLVY
jgi:hypothetical protein